MEQTKPETAERRRETQSVELFRVAYFAGRRVGMLSLDGLNPHPDPNDELHAAWNLGRFSGVARRFAEAAARRRAA